MVLIFIIYDIDDIDENLIKYWVRSLGPVYSKPDTTSWTNSPEFPLD